MGVRQYNNVCHHCDQRFIRTSLDHVCPICGEWMEHTAFTECDICGTQVILDKFMNTCDCGALYNWAGKPLSAPPRLGRMA